MAAAQTESPHSTDPDALHEAPPTRQNQTGNLLLMTLLVTFKVLYIAYS